MTDYWGLKELSAVAHSADVGGVLGAPCAPMIPQLLSNGRCPGRVFRNLRAILGRMPTKGELGLRWWQTVELHQTHDEMLVVNAAARRWRRIWLRIWQWLLWWTADVPGRVRGWYGPDTYEDRAYGEQVIVPREGSRFDYGGWPRVVVSTSVRRHEWTGLNGHRREALSATWVTRRMTLSEWLRGPR